MKKIINKTVNLDLIGVDGNAHAIIGAFGKQAKIDGWSHQEIELVLEVALKSEYVNLLATIENHCQVKTEKSELNFEIVNQFEIYWSDLTDEAKERLQIIYHENIELSPIAIIDIENLEG
jgi:hypothetical protein